MDKEIKVTVNDVTKGEKTEKTDEPEVTPAQGEGSDPNVKDTAASVVVTAEGSEDNKKETEVVQGEKDGKDGGEPEPEPEPTEVQYKVLVEEIRKALKPDLEANKLEVLKINEALNDKKTGFVTRLGVAEGNLDDIRKKVLTPKTGLTARLDRLEGFAKTDEKSLSVRLGVTEGLLTGPTTGIQTRLSRVERILDDTEDGYDALSMKVSSLHDDVNGPEGLTKKVEQVADELKGINEAIINTKDDTSGVTVDIPLIQSYKRKCEDVVAENKLQKQKLDTACGMIEVMSKQINTLQSQTAANAAKHMSNDLIVGGMKVLADEDPFEATANFFTDRLEIEFDAAGILDAYRSRYVAERNFGGSTVKIPPVMFVRVTEQLRRLVLKNTWKLTNVKQLPEGYGMYVRQGLPEPFRAVRRKFSGYTERIKVRNKGKNEQDKTRFWFAGERFFVDGSVITERISAPSCKDILNVTDIQKEQMAAIKLFRSEPETESNSTFQAFGLETDDIELAKLAYIKIKTKQIRCDHVMMAYRIVRENKLIQGSVSDGEHFGDIEILELLKKKERANVAIFVSREYGGVHLGRRRFQIIKQVAETVLDHVGGKHLPQPASEVGSSGPPGSATKRKQWSNGSAKGSYSPRQEKSGAKNGGSSGSRGGYSGSGSGSGNGSGGYRGSSGYGGGGGRGGYNSGGFQRGGGAKSGFQSRSKVSSGQGYGHQKWNNYNQEDRNRGQFFRTRDRDKQSDYREDYRDSHSDTYDRESYHW